MNPEQKPVQLPLGIRLRDDATFANYYAGANAAAQGYIERACHAQDAWVDSFIWLWGKPGSGRSHLLQAACLRAEEQGLRAQYLPLQECLDYGPGVLDGVEYCDLLALDDVQLVAGQPGWEQGLFHAFNRLRDAGKRLLISADCSPRELVIDLPDLHSRFNLALVFHLQELDDDEKLRALQLRASRRGLYLSDEVGRFLLGRLTRSMDALFAALEQLDQASLQAQRKLTIPFVKDVLFGDNGRL
ncbi:DnaA regulatory inactivator Hda [Thiopseudomonas denitrificans]|uniref:Regulatory inactivation of DnaA Hda protein n=1 Tax=Thiopseudomonas denitrificans TaxID=1501432 RepID=A0A4R6TZP5_9GAMM|nr:DnaA regulatory inactivator Hda [Thiopseudomonas denitrificans]TDQ39488.1 regulatory inactivation of DnaA Hda protein [Thiopseudomonas denitrificans]